MSFLCEFQGYTSSAKYMSWLTSNATFSSGQVRERCVPLLKETQSLLPPLEEMEKNITGFYQALEKASHITSNTDSEGPVDFKQKCQVTRAVPVSAMPTQENFTLDLTNS